MSKLDLSFEDTRPQRTISKVYYIISEDKLSCTDYIKELGRIYTNSIIEVLAIGDTSMCKVERLEKMVKDYIDVHNKELWENDEKCYIIDFDIIETDGP